MFFKKNRKKHKRAAIYIAGDANIFFPAVVALASIEKHNPSYFDYFICFDKDSLTQSMAKLLRKHRVKFIDSKDVQGYEAALKLGMMNEGRWPAEVYLNWCLPQHLHTLGYLSSIKVDYDVLCTGSLVNLSKYSDTYAFSFLKTKVDTHVPLAALEAVKDKTGLKETRLFSINTGVAVFDNKACVELSFYEQVFNIVEAFIEHCPGIRTLEQAAIALYVSNFEDKFKEIPKKFHQRVIAATNAEKLNPDVFLIHYLTKFKPWLPFTINDLKDCSLNGSCFIPIYRNVWLKFAMTIDGFSEFCNERPYSDLELIGLSRPC